MSASLTASFVAAWLVQGVVIAALFAGTAALLQWIARDAVPARAIWSAALLGATVLTCLAPLRLADPAHEGGSVLVRGLPMPAEGSAVDRPSLSVALGALGVRARMVLETPMRVAGDWMLGVPDSFARGVLVAWALLTGSLALLLLASHRRLRRALDRAERHAIDSVPVRITRDLGPAVVGVRDPVVAVPRWLLDLPSSEQSLVVRHERSHVVARDPLLLLSGVALAVLQPWNPFAWLMLSRLRLAIELDCDRRLLGTGTSPRAYGDALIALAAGAASPRRPALLHPMFSHHHSHLAQRIIAMTERPVRLITARRFAVAALSAVAFVAACESRLPTDAEVREMDAETAVRSVSGVAAIDPAAVRYIVDGSLVETEVAKAIPADRITGVSVLNGKSEIYITTDDSARVRRNGAQTETVVEGRPLDRSMVVTRDGRDGPVLVRRAPGNGEFMKGFTGVLVLDGEVVDNATFGQLTADRIASVEVVKGPAATRLYGPNAATGAIVVKTKPRR